jgi:hypothetical protein
MQVTVTCDVTVTCLKRQVGSCSLSGQNIDL